MKIKLYIWLLILSPVSLTLTAQTTIQDLEKQASEQLSQGQYQNALTLYQETIALIEDSSLYATTFAYAGMCAQALNNLPLTKAYYYTAINIGIEESIVFDRLADILHDEKAFDEELSIYLLAAERAPDERLKYQLKIAGIYKNKKDGKQLYTISNQILEEYPNVVQALEYKGIGLQYQNKMEEASRVFKQIYTIEPQHINCNLFLGNYNYQLGKRKLDDHRKTYDAINNPTRVQWHDHNEESKAIMETYFRPAICHLENVYAQKPGIKSVKNMLFTMYNKLGETEKASIYEQE